MQRVAEVSNRTSSFLGNQPNDSSDADIVDDDNDLLTAFAGTSGV